MASVKVGTSGWSYDHWAGPFYPPGTPAAGRLRYYATRLATVEIDATFYRMPSEKAVLAWRDQVPEGFAFAVKGSRYVTHFRRLEGAEEAIRRFTERVGLLGRHLEVVLWQLPPNLERDDRLLDAFLAQLPGGVRHAVEFRHPSWLAQGAFDVLSAHGAAHVQVSSDVMPQNLAVTAGFVYVRFHGTEEYHGAYVRPALESWRAFLQAQVAAGIDAYAYFNNDAEAHAPSDALRLAAMLGPAAYRL